MKPVLIQLVLLIVLASYAQADDRKVSRLIPTAGNLHVYTTGLPPDEHRRLADQFKKSLPSLGNGSIYDLRELVQISGVTPGPGDLVLYSPDTKLIYIRASQENVDMTASLFGSCCPDPIAYDVALTALRGDTRIGFFEVASMSGTESQISFADPKSSKADKKMAFHFIVEPTGRIDFTLEGLLPLAGEATSLSLRSLVDPNQTVTIFEQSAGSTVNNPLRLQLRIIPRYSPEQLEKTLEWQDRKIKEIEAELARSAP